MEEVVERLRRLGATRVDSLPVVNEGVVFQLPAELR